MKKLGSAFRPNEPAGWMDEDVRERRRRSPQRR